MPNRKTIFRKIIEGILDRFFKFLKLDVVAGDASQTRKVVKNLTGLVVTLIVIFGAGGWGGFVLRGCSAKIEIASYRDKAESADSGYRQQGRIVESYRLEHEKLRSQIKGFLPEDIARKLESIPAKDWMAAAFSGLSNTLTAKVNDELHPSFGSRLVRFIAKFPTIIPQFKAGTNEFIGKMNQQEYSQLLELLGQREANRYIEALKPEEYLEVGDVSWEISGGGGSTKIGFRLKPEFRDLLSK